MKKFLFIFLIFQIFFAFGAIKAIVFDHGGVLTEAKDKSQVKAYLHTTFSLSDEEVKAVWKKFKKSNEAEKFFQSLAKEKNVTLPSGWFIKFEEMAAQSMKLNPSMIKLAKELKEKGYKVAIFSNVKKPLDRYLRKLGHYDGFDPVVLSSEIGYEKPNLQAYKILIEKLKLKNDEFIFIDDSLTNVQAAKSLGIDSIHFHSYEELKEELFKRKIFLNYPL